MTKREIIFNKFGGKCAYCGCDLVKGWHIDEILPVKRKYKYIQPHWKNKTTGEKFPILMDGMNRIEWEYVIGKNVLDGCFNPENYNLENQNPACASCNINKHEMSLEQFRSLIAGFMKHLNEVSTQYKLAKRYGLVVETNIDVKFYFETLTNKP
jgi:5-methylcytosine-specific restriction endonuclease McrA